MLTSLSLSFDLNSTFVPSIATANTEEHKGILGLPHKDMNRKDEETFRLKELYGDECDLTGALIILSRNNISFYSLKAN